MSVSLAGNSSNFALCGRILEALHGVATEQVQLVHIHSRSKWVSFLAVWVARDLRVYLLVDFPQVLSRQQVSWEG